MRKIRYVYIVDTEHFDGPVLNHVEGFYSTKKEMCGVLRAVGFKYNSETGDWYTGKSIYYGDSYAYVKRIESGVDNWKQEIEAGIKLVLFKFKLYKY